MTIQWIFATALAVSWTAVTPLSAQATFSVDPIAVGNKLETFTSILLSQPAPADGLDVVLQVSEPAGLLLSKSPDHAGAATLTLHMRPGMRESPEFWVQGARSAGTATYSIAAPGYTTGIGSVSLSASTVAVVGPLKAPRFPTTRSAEPIAITLLTARLDDAGNFVQEQALAGGLSITPELTSSSPAVGSLTAKPSAMTGGTSSQVVRFQPASEGETTLSVVAPAGFNIPKQFASLVMVVRKPGLAVSEQMYIGQNLQIAGVLSLGEAAPAGGLTVTLTSEDPKRLLVSPAASEVGSGRVSVAVPAGGTSAQYYLQALGSTGTVSYTASAEGFQSRTGVVGLSPSGILLTPVSQGPPDEAHVLRKEGAESVHRYSTTLANPAPGSLVAWTAQLDPATHRGADITVQPLRAGMNLSIMLANSNPEIVGVAKSVEIKGSSDHGWVELKPLAAGTTEIDIATPSGFIQAANATKVIVTIDK